MTYTISHSSIFHIYPSRSMCAVDIPSDVCCLGLFWNECWIKVRVREIRHGLKSYIIGVQFELMLLTQLEVMLLLNAAEQNILIFILIRYCRMATPAAPFVFRVARILPLPPYRARSNRKCTEQQFSQRRLISALCRVSAFLFCGLFKSVNKIST